MISKDTSTDTEKEGTIGEEIEERKDKKKQQRLKKIDKVPGNVQVPCIPQLFNY